MLESMRIFRTFCSDGQCVSGLEGDIESVFVSGLQMQSSITHE